jgi:hypothetical protein
MSAEAETLARKLNEVVNRADKQLSTLMMIKRPLKESDFHNFNKLLKRQRDIYGWPGHIVPDDPLNTPDLTQNERNALDANTVADLTTILHIRNAYAFIHACVEDHQVAGLLETCVPGRAREAMDVIRRFFLPTSHAGKRAATQKFNNATMANTQTNIIEWISLVRQNAMYLKEIGGQADDQAQMTVLIGGLLPDFDLMKHTLDQNKNLDLETTIADLVEYSRTQGLLAVAKGKGAAQSGSKVFNVADGDDKPRVPFADRPCRAWAAKNCTYGERCKFSHAAPGGHWL